MKNETSRELIKFLARFAKKLNVAEHIYIVGGAVRNFVLNEPIKDIDLVIDSLALNGKDSEWFAKKLTEKIPAKLATNQYGVAILTITDDWFLGSENMKGEVIEIANARTETYSGGYKPNEVKTSSIQDDVYRREFTFNTLLWKLLDLTDGPDKAEIIDITGCGLKDLRNKKMRCPRNPDIVFTEDGSRLIRVIKFIYKYDFEIPDDLKESIKRNSDKLRNVPPSHLSNMIINLFYEEGYGIQALKEMKSLGLLDVLKQIIQENESARQALAHWVDSHAEIQFIFDLMDIGMPSGKKLKFLNDAQLKRLRELTVNWTAEESKQFVDMLNQPGKLIDMEAVIEQTGLKGSEISNIRKEFIDMILENPSFRFIPDRFQTLLVDRLKNKF